MTKEQILALNLSADEKKQVESAFEVKRRLESKGGHATCRFEDCADEAAVKQLCVKLKAAAEKRKIAAAKKAQKEAESSETGKKITAMLAKAQNAGISSEEVIKAIEDKIKAKVNADIDAKIAELMKQKM